MKVTKAIRKDINKLCKLVYKNKDNNNSYIRNDLHNQLELGICKKGMIRYLIDEVENDRMLHSTILYLIYANEKSQEEKEDELRSTMVH